ncbi:hypothetical protein [Micromonospora echinofusca]|uniref:BioF2-like acetyltransferase domain-containing protein n=1 Tax=Micromonospora echinofusca TaxID=47858 RepID=A0ABS3VV33_MICEH|nr:hypothetical protein [Micromonospora echinofusca]MBO4208394.1 hypothetical protein [Micromonospora echinofusca]
MTAATVDLDCWAGLSGSRSPYQWPQWYAAAGWLPRTRLLTAGRAAVPVWLLDRSAGPHYFHDPVELLTGVREEQFLAGDAGLAAALREQTAASRVLLTMSPYGYRGGALAGDADRGDLVELVARMREHAAGVGASMVVSHYLFDGDDDPWLAALTAAGGVRVLLGADAVLDVTWDSLADYWRWLGSSRRSLRRGRNVPDDRRLVWEVREEPGRSPAQRDVADLLHHQVTRFDPTAPAPVGLLREVTDGYALPRTLLSVAEPGRPARSAAVVLRRTDTLYAKFFGSREARADYLPLAYPRLISYAIAGGFRRIEYGGGSHQAKLMRGARLRPCWGVLFVLDRASCDGLESLARRVSLRKLAYFADLVRTWQVDSLPVHPAFAGVGLQGSSSGGDQ